MVRGAEHVIGRTSGTKKNDNSDNGVSKYEGFAAGSTDSAQAPGCETTAASIPHEYFIVISFIQFGVDVRMDTIVIDYKAL